MQTAVITGASSGLGIEFALTLAKSHPEIDELWLIARREDRLQALADRVKKIRPMEIRILPLDLTTPEGISVYTEALREQKAEIKILINNAGAGMLGNVWEENAPKQAMTVDLNCRVVTQMSAITIPFMRSGSAILNVCSIAAFVPTPRMTVYSATKAYVLAFSKGLHFELKEKGINCMAVCPCPMKTEFLTVGGIEGKSKTFQTLPYVEPANVASAAVNKALSGHCVYTPKVFYKFYRVISRIVPHGWLMHMSKV